MAQGAELSSKDGEGRTALHHAVMRSHLPAVDVILELGGPKLLLAKDILGCTPVHLAAVQNQVLPHTQRPIMHPGPTAHADTCCPGGSRPSFRKKRTV